LGRIEPVMQGYVDRNQLPGLVTAIARDGRLAHLKCFGMMDIEAGKSMQDDTIFQIQSLTKPVTGVATLMLYEDGLFQLKEPVSNFIPKFKELPVLVNRTAAGLELDNLQREITIHDLLTHTSGLSYASQASPAMASLHAEVDVTRPGSTLHERVEKLLKLPLAHQPGQMWRYGFSYDVLAYLVELISGQSFDVFLEQRLFEPLGMKDTGFCLPIEKIERLAAVYGPAENGGLELLEAPATSGLLDPQRPAFGSTGLISTVPDFLRFAQLLLNGGVLQGTRLLSPKTIRLMTLNHLPRALLASFNIARHSDGAYTKGYGFGLGVRVRMDLVRNELPGSEGEYGWFGIYNTCFWVDPAQKLIALVWTQSTLPMVQGPIERQFKDLTYRALLD
jgi:CubicO group peptidase (beta-lactamase class C family)